MRKRNVKSTLRQWARFVAVPLFAVMLLVLLGSEGLPAAAELASGETSVAPSPAVRSGETVGTPWVGDPGIKKTTAEIMAQPPLQRPTNFDSLRLNWELEQPERENLPQAPGAIESPQWPLKDRSARQPSASPLSPQTIGVSFDGATGPGLGEGVPPDCMGAVGPTQFVVFTNFWIRSFNKSTGVADGVLNVSPDLFFASVITPPGSGEVSFTADPSVRYDRLSGRWFLTMIDVITNGPTLTRPNLILIAVSSGSIISGATVWNLYHYQNSATLFADYPSLGIDADALYIGTDQFTLAGSLSNTYGYVIRKAPLLTGSAIVVTTFTGLLDGSFAGPWAPRGVDNYDPTNTGPSAVGYFIGVDGATFGTLMLRRITNPGGTPTISANISIPTTISTSYPVKVPHLGNTGGTNGRLDALDDRLYAAHLRNGRLWTAHNIGVNNTGVAGGANRNAARWYEIQNLTTTPTVRQAGTLYDNNATNDVNQRNYWIPSITVSGQGHAALGCSIAGTNERINAFTTGRLSGDALGTLQDGPGGSTLPGYTATTFAYNPLTNPGGAGGRRWGDYSFTSLDPNDDMTMWTIQEYCDGANTYGVQAVQLMAPPPATPSVATPDIVRQGDTGVNVVITGTSISGSGFYDPGASFSNRIAGSVSGTGVAVNSIIFTDPTHVTLNLTVSGSAPTGDRTVTITNPDGQSTTSPAIPAILTVDIPLPIQLASFRGSFLSPNIVRLDWVTVSEVNNFGFEVERSSDLLSNFTTILGSFTPGHGTTNEIHYYTYVDGSPGGATVYYKLKQIDLDGTVNYSDPIVVSTATSVTIPMVPTEFSLAQNAPNPFNPTTTIRYALPHTFFVTLTVYNPLGQQVAQLVNEQQQLGYHDVVFRGDGLASGVYFYRLDAGSFTSVKKLLLLK